MNKPQIIKLLNENLTPKYDLARDHAIFFLIGKANEYTAYKNTLDTEDQTINYKENPIWRSAYIGLYGYYDKKTKKQIQGTIYNGVPNNYQRFLHISEDLIIKELKRMYRMILIKLCESIYQDIKKLKCKDIVLGYSEHDINFILTLDGKKRSYTINTITAGGGYVQIIHNRTLKKLHTKVVGY